MFWRETKLFIQKGDEIRSIDGKYKNTEELGIHVTIRSNASPRHWRTSNKSTRDAVSGNKKMTHCRVKRREKCQEFPTFNTLVPKWS